MELQRGINGISPYSHFFLPAHFINPVPQNHVHWTQTPDSHIYTADLPGVRKEDIRVEIEDMTYMVIRTDLGDDEEISMEERRRDFRRKFRLPEMINVERISAGYEDGVLTVRVPRRFINRRPQAEDIVIDLSNGDRCSIARAA